MTTGLASDVALGSSDTPKFKLSIGPFGSYNSGGPFVIEVGEFSPSTSKTGLTNKAYTAIRANFH
jgi:hypothetical protein